MRHIEPVIPAAKHAEFCWDHVQNKKAETFELKRLKGVRTNVRVSKLGHDLWEIAISKVIKLLKIKHYKKRKREFEEITMPQFISLLEMLMSRIEDERLLQVGIRVKAGEEDEDKEEYHPCLNALFRFYYGGSTRSLRGLIFSFGFRFISNFLIIINMFYVIFVAGRIKRVEKPAPSSKRLLQGGGPPPPGGGGGGGGSG